MEEKLIAGIESLPMLPTVLVKLFSTSPEQENYFESVVGLAEGDPGLSLKIIKSSNSAASAPVAKIESLPKAILRLGTKHTVSLITSLMMAKVFNPQDVNEMAIWLHSLQVAAGARVLIRASKDTSLDPETGYLAGQLHDIGRLVLHAVDEDHFSVVKESDFQSSEELLQTEMSLYYGLTHTDLGLRVCEYWKLPEVISNTVRDHHLEYSDALRPTTDNKYIAAVVLADQLSMQLLENDRYLLMEQQQISGILAAPSLSGYREMLGLDSEQLTAFVEVIATDAKRIASTVGLSY